MMQAGEEWLDWVASVCGSSHARRGERIQALWSGYGEIVRVYLTGGTQRSVVVKRVQPPADGLHPRGWSGARSHERKLRSYRVERAFYTTFASSTVHSCRVPASLGALESESEWLFVLEDLDASGFVRRPDHLSARAMDTALRSDVIAELVRGFADLTHPHLRLIDLVKELRIPFLLLCKQLEFTIPQKTQH